MNGNGPVLRDILLPPAGWWPPAPGWWIVAALVVLVACAVAWLMWRRSRRRPLRAALREVDAFAARYARDGDVAALVADASRLMRRVARVVDSAVASRSGDSWRAFVHRYAHDAATKGALDQLNDGRYLANPVLDAPALLAALRAWCRRALRRLPPGWSSAARLSHSSRRGEGGGEVSGNVRARSRSAPEVGSS